MALIYRSIVEIDDAQATFTDRAPALARDWLRRKLQDEGFELPDTDEPWSNDGIEISVSRASDPTCSVVRVEVFEGAREDAAEVKTTLTALREPERSWAWVDLERWTHDHRTSRWVPAPPGVLRNVLRSEVARRGAIKLEDRPALFEGDAGSLLVDVVLDPLREVPVVVVSYNKSETDGVAQAFERGRELAKRLAGVAAVYVLGRDAVSAFSKEMLATFGPDMDVHSGAVRTYLPRAGSDSDYAGRHRFIPFHKLESRQSDLAARIIAPVLFRGAVETPPPAVWRSSARILLAGGPAEADYDELLKALDEENAELKRQVEELEAALSNERDSVMSLARQLDDLDRRQRFFREELRKLDPAAISYQPAVAFEPAFCSEVVEHARGTLSFLVVPEEIDEGVSELDEHPDESWARKAWLALRALDEYARAKSKGRYDKDFKTCCEQSGTDIVVPLSWVARKESKLTMENDRFRELRRLPVSTDVDPTGRLLMEAHIKIEQGGTPCPRIHFHDDTRGKTGKVHIGWFGDHLDSRAKS